MSSDRGTQIMVEQNMETAEPDFTRIEPAMKEAMAGLLTSQQGIQESITMIQHSFGRSGTKGAIHQDMLSQKVQALQNLAKLCDKVARQLATVAAKTSRAYSRRKVLAELQGINRFMADQVHSEQIDARRVLDALQGNGPADEIHF